MTDLQTLLTRIAREELKERYADPQWAAEAMAAAMIDKLQLSKEFGFFTAKTYNWDTVDGTKITMPQPTEHCRWVTPWMPTDD